MGKRVCPKCGKNIGFLNLSQTWGFKHFHPEWTGQQLHAKCYFEELGKITSCRECAFYTEEKELDAWGDEVYTESIAKCKKFDFEIEFNEIDQAIKCSSFVNKKEFREKALKGEIIPEVVLKTCQYCGTKYDPKKSQLCPKCGAS